MVEDRVLLARGASWSDKEVFFLFLFLLLLLLLSEAGVGGASGMELEVAQCMKNLLGVVVVMLNLVLLVSVKYTSTMVESGVAIGVLWLLTSWRILFCNLI